MKRIKRKRAISQVIADQPPLNATAVWKYPRDAFDDWLALGMGEADSYDEYLERLQDAEAAAKQYGLAILYCTMSPGDVAAWMISEGLDPTDPAHRAEAIGILATNDIGSRCE